MVSVISAVNVTVAPILPLERLWWVISFVLLDLYPSNTTTATSLLHTVCIGGICRHKWIQWTMGYVEGVLPHPGRTGCHQPHCLLEPLSRRVSLWHQQGQACWLLEGAERNQKELVDSYIAHTAGPTPVHHTSVPLSPVSGRGDADQLGFDLHQSLLLTSCREWQLDFFSWKCTLQVSVHP